MLFRAKLRISFINIQRTEVSISCDACKDQIYSKRIHSQQADWWENIAAECSVKMNELEKRDCNFHWGKIFASRIATQSETESVRTSEHRRFVPVMIWRENACETEIFNFSHSSSCSTEIQSVFAWFFNRKDEHKRAENSLCNGIYD